MNYVPHNESFTSEIVKKMMAADNEIEPSFMEDNAVETQEA